MYIVIEKFGFNPGSSNLSCPSVCTSEDGDTLVFDERSKAEEEAANCQDGIVVSLDGELHPDIIKALEAAQKLYKDI